MVVPRVELAEDPDSFPRNSTEEIMPKAKPLMVCAQPAALAPNNLTQCNRTIVFVSSLWTLCMYHKYVDQIETTTSKRK